MKSIFKLVVTGSLALSLSYSAHIIAAESRSIILPGGATATTDTTVLVHNALPVTARLKMHRDGSDNNFAQRQCRFRLISPNGAVDEVVRSIGATEETFELHLAAAGGGNAVRTWRVEIRNLEAAGNAEVTQAIRGTVEFFTTGSQVETVAAPPKFGLTQSDTTTKTVSLPFTGNLTVQANWDTDEISLENYRLRFEIYKGSTLLSTDTGYSRDSLILGISDSERMKISYQVKARDFQIPGDWRIKVYGSTKGKVKNVDLKVRISDGLYQ